MESDSGVQSQVVITRCLVIKQIARAPCSIFERRRSFVSKSQNYESTAPTSLILSTSENRSGDDPSDSDGLAQNLTNIDERMPS